MGEREGRPRWWRRFRFRHANAEPSEPAIDERSGLPAARWLTTQVKELEGRSLSERASIAVLKLRVEDHEHATEDELVDVAGQLQSCLRAYERLFRVGRRDFVLLAPGADLRKARALGRKLRDRVGSVSMWRGGRLDIRCGASASIEGEPFDFERVSAKADEALEEAEAYGGVAVAESVQPERLAVVEDGE